MIDEELLDKLLEYKTREEMNAFRAGMKYQAELAIVAEPAKVPEVAKQTLSFGVDPQLMPQPKPAKHMPGSLM